MAEFYLGQIMMYGFGFVNKGFAACTGSLLSVSQNQALFSLLGATYGGDGRTSFALPNLQGRTPVGAGASVDPIWNPPPYAQGTSIGTEAVTLNIPQMPAHSHFALASTQSGNALQEGALMGKTSDGTSNIYGTGVPQTNLSPNTIGMTGGSQPHPNIQPYSTINFNIAITGIFPSRS